jgi:hypothetical protein
MKIPADRKEYEPIEANENSSFVVSLKPSSYSKLGMRTHRRIQRINSED